MSTGQWVLSAEQFAAAWFGTGLDRLPYPFRFTSGFASLAEYEEFHRRFHAELETDRRAPLRRAIAILAQPDWRIELLGFDTVGRRGEIRAIGCGTGAGYGLIAEQRPAPDGGRIRLRRCRIDQLTTQLVGLLPDTPSGEVGEKRFLLEDLRDDRPDVFQNAPAREVQQRYQRFWRQHHTGRGTVTVLPGLRNASTRRVGRLRWLDTPHGRYCELPANRALMIKPMGGTDMVRYLDESTVRAKAQGVKAD